MNCNQIRCETIRFGRYANAPDYVRDLIRQDHVRLEALRQALKEGKTSGDALEFDMEVFVADKKRLMNL